MDDQQGIKVCEKNIKDFVTTQPAGDLWCIVVCFSRKARKTHNNTPQITCLSSCKISLFSQLPRKIKICIIYQKDKDGWLRHTFVEPDALMKGIHNIIQPPRWPDRFNFPHEPLRMVRAVSPQRSNSHFCLLTVMNERGILRQ